MPKHRHKTDVKMKIPNRMNLSLLRKAEGLSSFWPHLHVSRCFWTRNSFFPDSKISPCERTQKYREPPDVCGQKPYPAERKSCGLKNIWIRVDGALVWVVFWAKKDDLSGEGINGAALIGLGVEFARFGVGSGKVDPMLLSFHFPGTESPRQLKTVQTSILTKLTVDLNHLKKCCRTVSKWEVRWPRG